MLVLPKIVLVGLALKESFIKRNTLSRISSPPRGLWNSFTWIFLGLHPMIVLAERSIVWLLWMTIQDTYGFISLRRRVRLNKPSSSLPMKLNVNTTQRYWLSDNDTEFNNYTLDDFFGDEGIKHQYSAAYTPQQNGVAE